MTLITLMALMMIGSAPQGLHNLKVL